MPNKCLANVSHRGISPTLPRRYGRQMQKPRFVPDRAAPTNGCEHRCPEFRRVLARTADNFPKFYNEPSQDDTETDPVANEAEKLKISVPAATTSDSEDLQMFCSEHYDEDTELSSPTGAAGKMWG